MLETGEMGAVLPEQSDRRKRRDFITNVLWQGSAAAVLALRGLVMLSVISKFLGAESYGLFSQLSVTLTLIAPVLTLYVDAALVRYLAGESDRRRVSSQFFAAMLAVSVVSLLASCAAGWRWESELSRWVWGDSRYVAYARWLAWALVPTTLNLVALSLFQVRQEFRCTVAIQVGKSLTQLAAAYVAAVTGHGVLGATIGIAATELVFLVFMLAMAIPRVGRPYFDLGSLPMLLKYSLPLLPTHVALWLMNVGGRYVMVHYLDLQEVGVYAASFTLGSMAGLLINPITYVLLPAVSAQWSSGKQREALDLIGYASRLFLALAIPSSLGLAILSQSLLKTVATARFVGGATLVLPVALGTTAMGLFRIDNMLLLLEERTGQIATMLLMGLAVNLGLTLIAVPRYGAAGAAWAFVVSYGLVALWNLALHWRSRCRLGLRDLVVFGLKAALASGAMAVVMVLTLALLPAQRALSLAIAVCVGALVYGAGLWVTGAYSSDEVARLKGLLHRLGGFTEACLR